MMYLENTQLLSAPIHNKQAHKTNAREITGKKTQQLYSLSKKLVRLLMFVIPFFKTDSKS